MDDDAETTLSGSVHCRAWRQQLERPGCPI